MGRPPPSALILRTPDCQGFGAGDVVAEIPPTGRRDDINDPYFHIVMGSGTRRVKMSNVAHVLVG